MSSPTTVRIATRQSPLAMWQAQAVKDHLKICHPHLTISLVPMTTEGDKLLQDSLLKHGGKGLFIKELEQALLEGRADIAVHSMKDVTANFPPGLGLAAICKREDPRDAFISNRYASLADLPPGSLIGTSSLRRRALLHAYRHDLQSGILRGNVNSRLEKLDRGDFDGIILAVAGLKRLGLESRIRQYLPYELFLPAVGQGAIGIECALDNKATWALVQALNHEPSNLCVTAERAMNQRLDGGCHAPVAGFATMESGELWLRGLVATVDGQTIIHSDARQKPASAAALGVAVGDHLLAQGAKRILEEALPNA